MRGLVERGSARRTLAIMLAVLTVLVLGLIRGLNTGKGPAGPTRPGAPAANPLPAGVSDPQLPFLSPAELDQRLAGIHDLGAGWIRIDLSWPVVQPAGPQVYDWTRYDRVVRAAAAHRLQVLGVLDYTAAWARLPACAEHFQCQPRSPQLFAGYATAAARHFRDSAVEAWEIWNEPNIRSFWLPAPNAAFYTALLVAAYRAVKAVDPSRPVLSGGLSPAGTVSQVSYSPLDFLDRMYGYGAAGSFDALAYHPYSYPNLPSQFNPASAWSQLAATPRSLRSILAAHGAARLPIWLTEVGAPTGGPGASSTCDERSFSAAHIAVSECLQAKLLSDALCQASRTADLGPTFVYSYQDRGQDPASVENFFGLLRADGSSKPSYRAVAAAIRHPCG